MNILHGLNLKEDTIAIEVFRSKGKGLAQAIADGDYLEWNERRIRAAFNFGRGTVSDFKEYEHNNREYCAIIYVQQLD